jgi:hypothetical protein
MSPFYFGDSTKPLFGIYSPAHPARDRQKALLICPAGFQDYMRSHRLLKQLAVNLSEQGIHVLRFDYSGCGDSAGSWEDSSVDDWISNIELAADELQALSMVNNLSFLGVRLGASLLANANLNSYSTRKFIFWDPILDGEQYLESLLKLQVNLVDDRSRFKVSRGSYLEEHDMELGGYPVSSDTRTKLASVNIPGIKWNNKQTLLLYSPTETDCSSFAEINSEVELKSLSLPCNWESLEHLESQVQVPELPSIVNDFIG